MAPECHREKKDDLAFLPSKWVKFQFCWFNLIFLLLRVDPSPILLYFYFFIRSELVRVDPTRTGGPSWSGPTFVLSLCGEKYPNRRRYEWRILSSLSSVVLVLNLMSISMFWEPDSPSSSLQRKIDFSRWLEGWLVLVLKHAKTHKIQHNNHTR